MSKNIIIKKGLNIRLDGKADKVYATTKPTQSYAIKPTDFHNLTPKLAVKESESVLAGDCIFFDNIMKVLKFVLLLVVPSKQLSEDKKEKFYK